MHRFRYSKVKDGTCATCGELPLKGDHSIRWWGCMSCLHKWPPNRMVWTQTCERCGGHLHCFTSTVQKYLEWGQYDSKVHVTAGELRAAGLDIPDTVPDTGWVPRSSIKTEVEDSETLEDGVVSFGLTHEFTQPFRWLRVELGEVIDES